MKKIFVNLKMYLNTKEEIINYINNLKEEKEKFVVFPEAIHLEKFISNGYITGIQNISKNICGPATGEISAKAAKSAGTKYALIAHSEIRKNFNEKDEDIYQKIKLALENNLTPVLCIGENYEEYMQNKTKEIIKNQIEKALKNIKEEIIISYEPVWAIGTGKTPTNEEIEKAASYIKNLTSENVKVLYGGSVSDKNIHTLNKIKNIDGFLIGAAGANPNSLKKIIEVA